MQLINKKTLLGMIPLSEKAIYNMEKRGDFPRRIALTTRNVAWDLAEGMQITRTRVLTAPDSALHSRKWIRG